jgi:O-antigen/teichoic acid export membrane protein
MLRTALLLAGSSGVVSALRFGRNVLLARLIGVEDYGVASTFALLMALVEMLSDLGLGRFLVQDREGDRAGFIAAIQALEVLRGAILAVLVFAFADPIAAFLGQPALGWAYRLLALMPLLHAAVHLDFMRQQRDMRFGLTVKADFAGAAVSLAALWPLGLWLGDFRVMLGMLLVESLARIGTAHVLAERPYRLGWDGAVAARALRFGWPLLAGGMLTFAGVQGERLIVANQYTATDLGLFSAALTLAMAPMIIVQRVVSGMLLPLLARERDNEAGFLRRTELSFELLLACGLGLMLIYVYAGPLALPLIYGPDFAPGAELVAILGIAFALRMIRSGPTSVSIAKGRTIHTLYANSARLVSFPVAYLIAIRGGSISTVALIGVAGEAASLILAYSLTVGLGLGPMLLRRAPVYALALVLILLLVAVSAGFFAGGLSPVVALALFSAVFVLCLQSPDHFARTLLRRRR